MLRGHEFEWLDARFRPFDPVYIDPRVQELAALDRWSTLRPVRDARARAAKSFARSLAAALRISSNSTSMAETTDDESLNQRLQRDPDLRRTVRSAIAKHVSQLGPQHAKTVKEAKRLPLEELADKPTFGSLVVIEAMLANIALLSEETNRALMTQVGLPYWGDRPRTQRTVLCDAPGPLLDSRHPILPLVVDSEERGLDVGCLPTALSVAKWYPYASAIGLCTSSPGGLPYLDVLALMIRPYPPADELLSSRRSRDSLGGMLDYVREQSMERAISDLTTGGTAPPVSAPDTSPGRGGQAAQPDLYIERYLTPLYVFQFCCQVNSITARWLEKHEPCTYDSLKRYVEALGLLQRAIPHERISEDLLSRIQDPVDFLPDPPKVESRRPLPSATDSGASQTRSAV